ncbi:diacylglycerol kinase family protein [Rhizobium halophilum]|uniref:diacylglycerol kinase family protein n=1 Tax=Rhizobium halophilum TaxID=2846852 RepID=UPI00293ED90A|nr:diacylglycerol kinase family protein [Rhizobium halophilum]
MHPLMTRREKARPTPPQEYANDQAGVAARQPELQKWKDCASTGAASPTRSKHQLSRAAAKETPSEAIVRRAADIGCVIVGGGDGSLNAAASGLLGTRLPLGVLPLGTCNDFARTIGLPLDLAEAINDIASGKTSPVDLGMANDYPFFNVASMGFSADLAASLTENAKKRWGKMGYAIAAAKLLAAPACSPQRSNMMVASRDSAPFKSRLATDVFTVAA